MSPSPATAVAPTGTASGTTAPSFMSGLQAWASPGNALTAIETVFSSPSTYLTAANLPMIAGLLLPPVGVIVLLFSMSGSSSAGGRRR